ncbi:MAG: type 2 periplasmic-binding domain-containing protein [Thermoanaerobaculia bacterium]
MRFLLVVTLMISAGVPPRELSFVVIVNRSNALTSVSRGELSAIMMKRTRSWPDRAEIVPVDQPAASPLRESFSRAVHGKRAAYVVRYWQRLIFSGRAVPPRELAGDAAVIEFVRSNAGAIGYVNGTGSIDEVKVLTVTE